VGHVAHMEEMRNASKFLIRKPEGKKPHGRPRHRWEDNIGMDRKEIWLGSVDWTHPTQDRD